MSLSRECTEDQFLSDVASHVLTIQHDDGVFRHLRLGKPGTYCMSFNLTTWPGHLAISGDMGTYVFNRLDDMFQFFRTKPYDRRDGTHEDFPINPSYWAEKCEAMNTRDGRGEGIKAYDRECLREHARYEWESHFSELMDDEGDLATNEAAQECWKEIETSVLGAENGYEAYQAAQDFEHEGFRFHDSWEWNNTSYTFRFLWCLYAITWGIRQYDAAKDSAPSEARLSEAH
jgi:hypothetical protein